MRAGELDRRITIASFTESQNAYGEPVKTWNTLATVWANVKPASGREFFNSNQRVAEVDTIFKIRYRDDVTPQMRVLYNGSIYDIKSILEIGGREEGLQILAQIEVA